MNSIKLDDRVEFLVERLDMTPYLASHGEEQDQQEEVDPSQNIYSLQSYVCHTGGKLKFPVYFQFHSHLDLFAQI